MNAYSKDLRIRVLAAVDRGERREEIVRLFGVSVATVGRWLRRRRESGEVAPRPSAVRRTPSILRTAEGRLASGPYARLTGLCFFVFAESMPGGPPAETADGQQRVCFCGWRLRRRSVTATGLCGRLPSIGQRGYGTTLGASCRERGTASRLAGPEGKSRA